MEAQLVPMVNYQSFRPTAPYASALKPRPSSAPAPRLRPDAPPMSTGGILPRSRPPLSPADEIAAMLAPGQTTESNDLSAFTPTSAELAAISRPITPDNRFFFRRTAIPILLTFGLILIGWGILLITAGQYNALLDLFPKWTAAALFIGGLFFFALAAVNILSLKHPSTTESSAMSQ
jgi:hypothetical protein